MPIGELIQQQEVQILRDWSAAASQSASGRGLSRPALINLIPAFLKTLGQPGEEASRRRRGFLESHLSHRLRQGFELHEVHVEFALLAQLLAKLVAAQPTGSQPMGAELATVFAELQTASEVATQVFNEHLLEDEQREKRYGRLIQEIATEALHATDGDRVLNSRLCEVLKLIMEAIGADSAALLLYDHATEQLLTAASAGIADEHLEKYATSLDPRSFAGRVAATPSEPVALWDAETTDLEVSETLRHSGIHSLVGVRLPARETLLGVLYVGVAEKREFSASEVRRLESLGDRLTLHLDNARLNRQLRVKNEQMRLFVDILAHDLRGPLGTARMATEMLNSNPERADVWLARARRNFDRAERMLVDLLDAHQLGAGGTLPLQLVATDVDALAREVAAEANQQQTHRSQVVVESEGVVAGPLSGEHVRRAVWNLVANAIKYGEAGGTVVIAVHGDRQAVTIGVHNDGPPIPEEDQRHLFEPFRRSSAAREGGLSGWGLGLALVNGCARSHGGRVEVRSRPGEGTTFFLRLPWQEATDRARISGESGHAQG